MEIENSHQPIWKNNNVIAVTILLALVFLWILIETIMAGNTGFGSKNLWDWLDLLIVPLLIPISIVLLSQIIQTNERNLAQDTAQREELQTFYDRMTDLLLEHKLGTEDENQGVRAIARSMTLTTIPSLNSQQKGQLLNFLYDANLLNEHLPIIPLQGFDLQHTDLPNGDLRKSHLRYGNFQKSNLTKTNLFHADLSNARLQHANLTETTLIQANCRSATFDFATMKDALLKDTDFRRASFVGSNLTGANMTGADMRRADFQDAILAGATLIETDFANATNLTIEQIKKGREINNIILPDGNTYSHTSS